MRTARHHHQPSLNDRTAAATEAKRASLEHFRARAAANTPVDPELAASHAAARAAQAALRAAAKHDRIERLKAEKAARVAQVAARARDDAAAALAKAAAVEAEALGAIERASILASEQKAARDLRYAARKARK